MQFEFDIEGATTRIAAVPGMFDAHPPVPHIELDLPLPDLTADRLAVGLALIFGRYLSGPVVMPRPISALTARRIAIWAQPRDVQAGPINPTPMALPRGAQAVTIRDVGDGAASQLPLVGGHCLALTTRTTHTGIARWGNRLAVASNIALFSEGRADQAEQRGSALPELGLAVLLAEYFDATILRHPSALTEAAPHARALLDAVGLGLTPP